MNKRLYVLLLSMFVMTLSVAQSPAQGNENENEKESSQTEASDEKKEDVITQPEFKGGIAKFT